VVGAAEKRGKSSSVDVVGKARGRKATREARRRTAGTGGAGGVVRRAIVAVLARLERREGTGWNGREVVER